MKRIFNLFLPSFILLLALFGCTKEDENDVPSFIEDEGFTLNATYGSDTKVAFDEDGLGLSWVPGDCLYLIDTTGKNSTVKLTTSITEPSKKASFSSTTSVLSGKYIVLYGGSSNKFLNPYNILSTDKNLSSHIYLYGSLTITDGQTSANIVLNHCFAKLKFTLKNVPGGLSETSFGMAVSKEGIPFRGNIESKGFNSTNYNHSKIVSFGGNNIGSGMSTLVAPKDYTGSIVLFYCYGTLDGKHITYEIQKSGINLVAGNNYNIEFDFSKAGKSVLDKVDGSFELSSAIDFRAAAYWNQSKNHYDVGSDLDFKDEIFIPIKAYELNGKNHILRNISIDYSKCDSVGMMSHCCNINRIALEDANIIGSNKVGALSGLAANISMCIVKGNTNVYGYSKVGGLVGNLFRDEYVLGNGSCRTCGFEGNVNGNDCVGGICGFGGYGLTNSTIDRCYVKGNVTGVKLVGGIVGSFPASGAGVHNSYIIGNVEGSTLAVGGICGYDEYTYPLCVSYCYSNGTVSNSIGICNYVTSAEATSNLTSSSKIYSNSTGLADYCGCGVNKTFLSKISVINGNEAFSTQVWPGIDAQCPLLQWQSDALNGDIDIPGYGDVNW